MRKSLKRWPVLVALPLLVAVGSLAVGLVCLPRGSRITEENCKRIQEGMTEAQVRAILGKPWEDSLFDPEGPVGARFTERRWKYSREWISDDCQVFVTFDDNGRVLDAVLLPEVARDFSYRSWLPARVWRRLRARYGW
jgi:outer membrane protein assembly factor BamE (lipoprotein component of BamABCDE complex)